MTIAESETTGLHVVSAYVPVELREEFARLAETNFRTLSAELRLAMTRHVEASRELTGAER